MIRNIYLPERAVIKETRSETADIKTFLLHFKNKKLGREFCFRPGQFVMVSVPHTGEMPISISSSPSRPEGLELSIKRVGTCTKKMHGFTVGAEIGLRGPYGQSFPLERLEGENLLFVAGGIGLAPLRSLICYVLDKRTKFGKVAILHGARTPEDIPFKEDLCRWAERNDVRVFVTVDRPAPEWSGYVGPVTGLWSEIDLSNGSYALMCGPPLMISAVSRDLVSMGLSEDRIISTLERHMKCGVGKCGHCSVGEKLICTDGPVFTYNEVKRIPAGL